jgi:phage/plasmid-like protein (TIGR03299 family)
MSKATASVEKEKPSPAATAAAMGPGAVIAPWQRDNGRAVFGATTAKEAMKKAGLDWTVDLRPMVTDQGSPVPDRKAVVRSTDKTVLSTVGNNYRPVQNSSAFDLMNGQVANGNAAFDSAGYFDNGNRIWVLCKLKGDLIVGKDDLVQKFLLLHNAHDGSHKLRMFITPIRISCKNSLNCALGSAGTDGLAIGHTAKVEQQLKAAAEALDQAAKYYLNFNKVAQQLLKTKFTEARMKELAAHILPVKHDDEETEAEAEPSAITQKNRDRIVELFTEGAGHKGIEGTAWAALNAVAEWTDHHRNTRSDENRLRSSWFGKGARLKREAFAFLTAKQAA